MDRSNQKEQQEFIEELIGDNESLKAKIEILQNRLGQKEAELDQQEGRKFYI